MSLQCYVSLRQGQDCKHWPGTMIVHCAISYDIQAFPVLSKEDYLSLDEHAILTTSTLRSNMGKRREDVAGHATAPHGSVEWLRSLRSQNVRTMALQTFPNLQRSLSDIRMATIRREEAIYPTSSIWGNQWKLFFKERIKFKSWQSTRFQFRDICDRAFRTVCAPAREGKGR